MLVDRGETRLGGRGSARPVRRRRRNRVRALGAEADEGQQAEDGPRLAEGKHVDGPDTGCDSDEDVIVVVVIVESGEPARIRGKRIRRGGECNDDPQEHQDQQLAELHHDAPMGAHYGSSGGGCQREEILHSAHDPLVTVSASVEIGLESWVE